MSEIRTLQDLDKQCLQARDHFRSHCSEEHGEIHYVFNLCFDLFKSIGKFKNPEEWKNSREEYTLSVLIQALETSLAMYYLAESGFWTNSLALQRNVVELMGIAIAIGYDEQCFIDWKYERNCFDDSNKILRRIQDSEKVPDIDKSRLPHLKRYWIKSSQLFSHNIKPNSIRTLPKAGQFKFEPKIANSEFQAKRLHAVRNMILEIISIAVGVFNYDVVVRSRKSEFPEAPEIIAMCNQCFQNEIWKKHATI